VATITRPLERADAELDLRRPARALYDQWRAFQPWPGSFVQVGGKRIAVPAMDPPTPESRGVGQAGFEAGVVSLGCVKGALRIRELKPEGRRSMSARAFVNGYAELLDARWGGPLSDPRAPLTGPVR
jgi:methionyl-tRNA formyltransferase